MDPFDDVVSAMSVASSLYVRFRLTSPWGVAFDTGYQARLMMIAEGGGWLLAADEDPRPIGKGDCLIIKEGTRFALADTPASRIVDCGELFVHLPDFSPETGFTTIPDRTVHHGGGGALMEIVSARLSFDPVAAEPLLALLPDLLHVRLTDGDLALLETTLNLIGAETRGDGLGADLAVERLTDVLFIQTIRAWAAADKSQAGGWLAALRHRALARVIRTVHADLARDWTVDEMARVAGTSRSSFAQSFRSVLGETPLNYLTRWRMYRAKILMRKGATLAEIAVRVGYDSDTALSRAFRRVEGVAPGEWRRTLAQAPLTAS
jgi:AraC-like DNA-binding protein